jgi:hypothetical protein
MAGPHTRHGLQIVAWETLVYRGGRVQPGLGCLPTPNHNVSVAHQLPPAHGKETNNDAVVQVVIQNSGCIHARAQAHHHFLLLTAQPLAVGTCGRQSVRTNRQSGLVYIAKNSNSMNNITFVLFGKYCPIVDY